MKPHRWIITASLWDGDYEFYSLFRGWI